MEAIHVLHAFQKEATRRIATAERQIQLARTNWGGGTPLCPDVPGREGDTQAGLADIAGVNERFLRAVEHGKQSLRLDALGAPLVVFGARLVVARRSRDAGEEHEP